MGLNLLETFAVNFLD